MSHRRTRTRQSNTCGCHAEFPAQGEEERSGGEGFGVCSPVFTLKNGKNVPPHSSKYARYICKFFSGQRPLQPICKRPLDLLLQCPLALADLLKLHKFTQKGLLLMRARKEQQRSLKNPHIVPLEEVKLLFPASRSNETEKNFRDLARTWPRAKSALLC